MRVFLTGATGFLGAAVAAELASQGNEVTCLVRPGSDPWRLQPHLHNLALRDGDLADQEGLGGLLAEVAPEVVCHAAWWGVLGRDRNASSQASNAAMTANLVRLAADYGAGAFVSMGSQAEYGPLNRLARECDPTAPTTSYGMAKVTACQEAANVCAEAGLRFVWLRIFSLYGPGDHGSWLLPYVIQTLLRGERPALTLAEQHWDFLHVADAAKAVRAVIATSLQGICNLGSGDAPLLRETIETVRDLIDPSLPLGFGEIAYRPDQVMWLQADISRLAAIGWRPQISLPEGLKETIDWFRQS